MQARQRIPGRGSQDIAQPARIMASGSRHACRAGNYDSDTFRFPVIASSCSAIRYRTILVIIACAFFAGPVAAQSAMAGAPQLEQSRSELRTGSQMSYRGQLTACLVVLLFANRLFAHPAAAVARPPVLVSLHAAPCCRRKSRGAKPLGKASAAAARLLSDGPTDRSLRGTGAPRRRRISGIATTRSGSQTAG
jgi:hypothetical protein